MNRTYFNFTQIENEINSKHYPPIGSGSGRIVFDMKNGYVVKVAKNKKGLAQNKAELEIFSSAKSNLFAKIAGYSDDMTMIIMEKAAEIKDIYVIWSYFHVRSNRELLHVSELVSIANRHDLLLSDLCRPANWGRINGKPRIVDYGYTRNVMRKYYSFFPIYRD